MPRRVRHSETESAEKYRQGAELLASGATISQACKKLGVSEATFHRWRRKFTPSEQFEIGEAPATNKLMRFKRLELENKRLKLLVAELVLENAFLKDRIDRPESSNRSRKF